MQVIRVLKEVREMIGVDKEPTRLRLGALGRQSYAFMHINNPFRVLITTILSQRTRDENTRRAAEKLFDKYKTPRELSKAPISDIESLIKESGFYKVKAGRIKEVARIVSENVMPRSFDELMELPGVGRKTANCVLVYGYNEPAIPVDTHVHRVSNRLGIVSTRTPEQTELALMKLLPKKFWIEVNELLVRFGQKVCKPQKPLCNNCILNCSCQCR